LDAVHAEARSPSSPRAGSAGMDLIDVRPEERSQVAVREAPLIATRAGSPDRERNKRSDKGRKLKPLRNQRNSNTKGGWSYEAKV
jgi:hypothetical protein